MNHMLRVRVDLETKQKAEAVLKDMGLTLSVAVRMYLIHIAKTGKL